MQACVCYQMRQNWTPWSLSSWSLISEWILPKACLSSPFLPLSVQRPSWLFRLRLLCTFREFSQIDFPFVRILAFVTVTLFAKQIVYALTFLLMKPVMLCLRFKTCLHAANCSDLQKILKLLKIELQSASSCSFIYSTSEGILWTVSQLISCLIRIDSSFH